MKRKIIAWMVVLSSVAVAIAVFAWNWSPKGELVRASDFEGIILSFSADDIRRGAEPWLISRLDVVAMERALKLHVAAHTNQFGFKAAELPFFYREYIAEKSKGRRYIHVELFHRDCVARSMWQYERFVIMGGGWNIWRIEFDIESGTFGRPKANAPM